MTGAIIGEKEFEVALSNLTFLKPTAFFRFLTPQSDVKLTKYLSGRVGQSLKPFRSSAASLVSMIPVMKIGH